MQSESILSGQEKRTVFRRRLMFKIPWEFVAILKNQKVAKSDNLLSGEVYLLTEFKKGIKVFELGK